MQRVSAREAVCFLITTRAAPTLRNAQAQRAAPGPQPLPSYLSVIFTHDSCLLWLTGLIYGLFGLFTLWSIKQRSFSVQT